MHRRRAVAFVLLFRLEALVDAPGEGRAGGLVETAVLALGRGDALVEQREDVRSGEEVALPQI